jgi:cytochrome oxidase Cu insertion factor (SCO1/SenC/PrrC family)
MASAIDQLGAAGAAVQPLFITVDPEKDTREQLAAQVASAWYRLSVAPRPTVSARCESLC